MSTKNACLLKHSQLLVCVACAFCCIVMSACLAGEKQAAVASPAHDAKVGEWIEYDITEMMNGAMPLRERIEISGIDGDKFQISVTMTATPRGGMSQIMQEITKTVDNALDFEQGNYFRWCPDMIAAICEQFAANNKLDTTVGEETVTINGKTFKTNTITTGMKKGEMEYLYIKFYVAPDLPASGIVQIDMLTNAENAVLTRMSNYGWNN